MDTSCLSCIFPVACFWIITGRPKCILSLLIRRLPNYAHLTVSLKCSIVPMSLIRCLSRYSLTVRKGLFWTWDMWTSAFVRIGSSTRIGKLQWLICSKAVMFSIDLKNGYHHVDICCDHQTFLGFSWGFTDSSRPKYFVFTVLPFGLSTAPHIFTKPLEKY